MPSVQQVFLNSILITDSIFITFSLALICLPVILSINIIQYHRNKKFLKTNGFFFKSVSEYYYGRKTFEAEPPPPCTYHDVSVLIEELEEFLQTPETALETSGNHWLKETHIIICFGKLNISDTSQSESV